MIRLALPLPAPKLPDKRQTALAKARFKAWWDGAAFDEEKAAAEVDAALAAEAEAPKPEKAKPEKAKPEKAKAEKAQKPEKAKKKPSPEPDPAEFAESLLFEDDAGDARLQALQIVWGDGRIGPGDRQADALHPARLNLAATAKLGLFGPGLAASAWAMAETHPGEIQVFEWREECREALAAQIAEAGLSERVRVTPFDLETGQLAADSLDGIVSFDDFTHCDAAPRLALQMVKALKPQAMAVLEYYCAPPNTDLATAFAAAFLEPNPPAPQALAEILFEAGFRIEAEDDLTDEHAAIGREGLKRLAEVLARGEPMPPRRLQELAWEAEAWGARLRLLARGQLSRRQILVQKR